MSNVTCHILNVTCYMSLIIVHLSDVTNTISHSPCQLSHVKCHLHFTYMSFITNHRSLVTYIFFLCQISLVTCKISLVTCLVPHVTFHMSHVPIPPIRLSQRPLSDISPLSLCSPDFSKSFALTLLAVLDRMSLDTCHLSLVTCHISQVTCNLSHITCHLSHVTSHLSHVTLASRLHWHFLMSSITLTFSWHTLNRIGNVNTGVLLYTLQTYWNQRQIFKTLNTGFTVFSSSQSKNRRRPSHLQKNQALFAASLDSVMNRPMAFGLI